ncbi:MAG TPA: hypothetical protein VKB40_00640 [Candidatus Acidoferrales bacterium]|nr:hypothetical protein [Candidatus Acidoferrales bacterium]
MLWRTRDISFRDRATSATSAVDLSAAARARHEVRDADTYSPNAESLDVPPHRI